MIVDELKKQASSALESLGVKNPEVQFEHPADLAHGDYSTNVALVYAKELKMKQRELAEKIVKMIYDVGFQIYERKTIEKVEVAGAGFINFYLSKEFFAEAVQSVDEEFGRNKHLVGKKVMVEYTDPNPFKEFHIGHLMSNAIGESIARIFEFHGAKVVRACWQGDIGLHVAKAIWGLKRFKIYDLRFTIQELGRAYAKGSEAYETDGKAKAEINELNKKIFSRSDNEVNALYDAGRKVSLEHFEEIYKVLGTKFDHYFFEGKEGRDGQKIVEENIGRVFERSEGAVIYKGEKQGLHTRVFLTKEGLPTYEAKELGLNKAKFEKEPDIETSVIVTANEQSDYFKVVLAAMKEVLPEIAKKTRHIAHGMLRFASGKMSSRKGNVITGESLIEQVKGLVREKLRDRDMPEAEKEEVAEIVAVGAIKYSILRQAVGGDIIFELEKSVSFEGDSGPYLQYSYVRAKSVLAKAKDVLGVVNVKDVLNAKQLKHIEQLQPSPLDRLLYRFPEVVERAWKEYQPHYITTFLTELAGSFNSWYAKEQIVDVKDPASPYKVALTEAFATIMKNGLWLLGIQVPQHM